MATKDVTDEMVCAAYAEAERQRGKDWKGNYEWPYQILQRMTGQCEKVCYRAMERAAGRDLVEYGVSLRTGWLTASGLELAEKHNRNGVASMEKQDAGAIDESVAVAEKQSPTDKIYKGAALAIARQVESEIRLALNEVMGSEDWKFEDLTPRCAKIEVDGSETFVFDGVALITFGPVSFERVKEAGQTYLRVVRDIERHWEALEEIPGSLH